MHALLARLDPSIAVLLIEHDMDVAFGFAENVTVLYQGRVLAEGDRRRDQRQSPRAGDLSGSESVGDARIGRRRSKDRPLHCDM